MDNIIKLFDEFEKIRNLGWIESINKGYSSVGLTFEKLLGKEIENFEIPDYYGIEIKTKAYYARKYIPSISLFHATPDGKYLFETKRLVETYGYPDKNDRNYKVLNVVCSTQYRTKIGNGYSMQLKINYKEEKIYLKIYNQHDILVDTETFWFFKTLEEKLYRKLKIVAYIKAQRKKINNIEHFRYQYIDFYKLKNFDEFIKLIENGKIVITFKIGRFRTGKKRGQIHDHGTAFVINENALEELYYKIPFIEYC